MTRALLPRNVREGMVDADEGQTPLGRAVVRDYANYRVLDRLGLYEQRIERSLFKTMGELERRRLIRQVDESSHASEGTRGLRTHPAADVCESGARKSNDKDEETSGCGNVKATALGDGAGGFGSHHRRGSLDATTEMASGLAIESGDDSNKQSQFDGDLGVERGRRGGAVKTEGRVG